MKTQKWPHKLLMINPMFFQYCQLAQNHPKFSFLFHKNVRSLCKMTLETAVAHSWKLFQLYLKRVHAQLELLMRFTFFNLARETTTASEAAEAVGAVEAAESVEAVCWLRTVSCISNT